jgi:hypothetical protein
MSQASAVRPFAVVIALLTGILATTAFLPIIPLYRSPLAPLGYTAPTTVRCAQLEYTGEVDPALPTIVRLSPERVPTANSAHPRFHAEAVRSRWQWHQPLWWQPAGADSIDIVFHHYPILRLPANLIGQGRVQSSEAVSMVALLSMGRSRWISSIPVTCP